MYRGAYPHLKVVKSGSKCTEGQPPPRHSHGQATGAGYVLCKKNERCETRWYLSGEGKKREEVGATLPGLHSLRKHNQNFSFYHPTLSLVSRGPDHSYKAWGKLLTCGYSPTTLKEYAWFRKEREWNWRNVIITHIFFFHHDKYRHTRSLGFPGSSVSKETACSAGDLGSIPGSARSPGEGNGNPMQYSCLENSMERGAWWAAVHGVTRVEHDLVTKPRPPPGVSLEHSEKSWNALNSALRLCQKQMWLVKNRICISHMFTELQILGLLWFKIIFAFMSLDLDIIIIAVTITPPDSRYQESWKTDTRRGGRRRKLGNKSRLRKLISP